MIPKSGRFPEEGHSNPLQYSCLGNPMDRGAWRAIVHGVAKESEITATTTTKQQQQQQQQQREQTTLKNGPNT